MLFAILSCTGQPAPVKHSPRSRLPEGNSAQSLCSWAASGSSRSLRPPGRAQTNLFRRIFPLLSPIDALGSAQLLLERRGCRGACCAADVNRPGLLPFFRSIGVSLPACGSVYKYFYVVLFIQNWNILARHSLFQTAVLPPGGIATRKGGNSHNQFPDRDEVNRLRSHPCSANSIFKAGLFSPAATASDISFPTPSYPEP